MKEKRKLKQTVKIGPKHQVVIPKDVRRACRGVEAGARVNVYALDENTVAISLAEDNWAEKNRGGLADLWRGMDPIKALQKMRDEWKD